LLGVTRLIDRLIAMAFLSRGAPINSSEARASVACESVHGS
jgi:hypothetical protein